MCATTWWVSRRTSSNAASQRPISGSPPPGSSTSRSRSFTSLPFDGPGRFARDVVRDTVHSGNLAHDPRRDTVQYLVGQAGPVRGHPILARHDPPDPPVLV